MTVTTLFSAGYHDAQNAARPRTIAAAQRLARTSTDQSQFSYWNGYLSGLKHRGDA